MKRIHLYAVLSLLGATLMNVSSVSAAMITVFENKCIDVRGGSTANGAQVQSWACNGEFAQQWNIVDGQIRGLGTSQFAGVTKCLDVRGFDTANGTPVQMWPCNGTDNQQWQIDQFGRIRGVQSNKCLDVTAGSTADGARLQIWDCNSRNNQRWKVR